MTAAADVSPVLHIQRRAEASVRGDHPAEGGEGMDFLMSWTKDGRATWQCDHELKAGDTHVVWRRISSSGIFGGP